MFAPEQVVLSAPLSVLAAAGIVSIKTEEAYRDVSVPAEPDRAVTLTGDQAGARDAVVGALLWPWGVYKYFVEAGGITPAKT